MADFIKSFAPVQEDDINIWWRTLIKNLKPVVANFTEESGTRATRYKTMLLRRNKTICSHEINNIACNHSLQHFAYH